MQPRDSESDFEGWISIFITQSVNNRSLDKVCFGHCSMMSLQQGSFGITELFKQAAQVTNCTQESREQDLAQTTPPGSMCCVCVCVCVRRRERGCVFLIEKDRDVCVYVMPIQEQLNFSTCQKCFPWVYHTTQLSMVFKSPLSAIRNGWFGLSNMKRLASLTMWKASGQSNSLSRTKTLTHWLALS